MRIGFVYYFYFNHGIFDWVLPISDQEQVIGSQNLKCSLKILKHTMLFSTFLFISWSFQHYLIFKLNKKISYLKNTIICIGTAAFFPPAKLKGHWLNSCFSSYFDENGMCNFFIFFISFKSIMKFFTAR